ncbi:RES family NAD+ phosphorylase [Escherichia coli]|uniref:RES family NAD+ phosphorylase n=1 Tax=Escherichia coli TaxID=562 RepID=UPI0012FF871A|nr:RES family NAD+ phosphorylase [Escherichia coli]
MNPHDRLRIVLDEARQQWRAFANVMLAHENRYIKWAGVAGIRLRAYSKTAIINFSKHLPGKTMLICEDHIVEPNVKNHVRLQTDNNICVFCNAVTKCLDTDSIEARNLLKAILRYNFDEVLYNTHIGGDYFPGFLLADDYIFCRDIQSYAEAFTDLDSEIWSMGFTTAGEIDIHSGHDQDGMMNMPLMSIINSYHPFIGKLSKKLAEVNYHEFEDELRDIIKDYGNSFAKIIEGGSVVYRARVGTAGYKKAHEDFNYEGKKIFVPYKNKEIGSVPPLKATAGRANRVGVSYLYCATDSYTAIAEVRPHPTDVVSLGKFSVSRALKVFDFSYPNLLDFIENGDTLLRMIPYAKMAGIYNTATPPSLEGRYSVSQLISDCIRKEGYDGIQFSSTVGEGKNLVVFNPSYMEFIEGSSTVIEIDKVQYTYKEKQVVGMNDQWEIYYNEVE